MKVVISVEPEWVTWTEYDANLDTHFIPRYRLDMSLNTSHMFSHIGTVGNMSAKMPYNWEGT